MIPPGTDPVQAAFGQALLAYGRLAYVAAVMAVATEADRRAAAAEEIEGPLGREVVTLGDLARDLRQLAEGSAAGQLLATPGPAVLAVPAAGADATYWRLVEFLRQRARDRRWSGDPAGGKALARAATDLDRVAAAVERGTWVTG